MDIAFCGRPLHLKPKKLSSATHFCFLSSVAMLNIRSPEKWNTTVHPTVVLRVERDNRTMPWAHPCHLYWMMTTDTCVVSIASGFMTPTAFLGR